MTFIHELVIRLWGDTPWFFKVVQIISVAAALIIGLPDWLRDSGVEIPGAWKSIGNEIVGYAAMVAAFVAQLTTTAEVKKAEGLRD